jgi:hypothetical protein
MGSAMRAVEDQSRIEWRHLRRLAGLHGARQRRILRTARMTTRSSRTSPVPLSRDRNDARKALATLREIGGGFAGLDETKAGAAMTLPRREDPATTALGRAVLQCYYRGNRVMCAMGLEPPPPFPKGNVLEQGDWSLLDVVRGRPRMCRDVDDRGK